MLRLKFKISNHKEDTFFIVHQSTKGACCPQPIIPDFRGSHRSRNEPRPSNKNRLTAKNRN